MKGGYLITAFLFGQVLDVVSTYSAITYFGQQELNPVALSLFQKVGMIEVMSAKLLLALFLIGAYTIARIQRNLFHKPLEISLQISSFVFWLAGVINVSGIALIASR